MLFIKPCSGQTKTELGLIQTFMSVTFSVGTRECDSKQITWLLMSSAPLMGQYYFGAILLGRVGSRTYSVFTQFAHFALKKYIYKK